MRASTFCVEYLFLEHSLTLPCSALLRCESSVGSFGKRILVWEDLSGVDRGSRGVLVECEG